MYLREVNDKGTAGCLKKVYSAEACYRTSLRRRRPEYGNIFSSIYVFNK